MGDVQLLRKTNTKKIYISKNISHNTFLHGSSKHMSDNYNPLLLHALRFTATFMFRASGKLRLRHFFFYFLPFRFFIVASFPFPSIIAYRRDPSDALARRLWCPNEVSSLTTSTVRLPSLFPSFRCVYRICTLFTSKVRKMRSFLHRVHRGFFFRNWIALTSAWPFYLSSTARYTFYILATRQKVEKMNKGKAGRRRNRSALV